MLIESKLQWTVARGVGWARAIDSITFDHILCLWLAKQIKYEDEERAVPSLKKFVVSYAGKSGKFLKV